LFNNEENLSDLERTFFHDLATAGLSGIDMREVFLAEGGVELYYQKTDHHFNFAGAFLTYQTICKELAKLGIVVPVLSEEDIEFCELPQPFLGSRARKVYGVTPVEDKIFIYKPEKALEFSRYDNGQEVTAAVFDLPESIDDEITFLVYMGGDKAETIIKTNRPELPKLLIFGDSFTNPLETLLYASFDETRSIDLRYYKDMEILEYILDYRPDVVILVRDDNLYLVQEGNGLIR
jgi:hypothetical protein